AELDGRGVGMMGLERLYMYEESGGDCGIGGVVIDKEYRGWGMGGEVIEGGEDWGCGEGMERVCVKRGNGGEGEIGDGFYREMG
ncbi:GNAT family N-acetyltransferase, partial [Paenibacillus xylanexedens]|uniref:GNAT family N-acetyltransferase n=1 Tax=Paenibacillus xylanexedens TaxID=528191 RepID=UPI0011A37207